MYFLIQLSLPIAKTLGVEAPPSLKTNFLSTELLHNTLTRAGKLFQIHYRTIFLIEQFTLCKLNCTQTSINFAQFCSNYEYLSAIFQLF